MRWIFLLVCLIMVGIGIRHAVKSTGAKEDFLDDFSDEDSDGPNSLQEAFKNYIEVLFKGKGVTIYDSCILGRETLTKIPFSDGAFFFDRISYKIEYDENSEVLNGMKLSSKELMAAAGITDNLVVMYFLPPDGIPCEAIITTEKKASMNGYPMFISHRYSQMIEKTPLEEYAFLIDGEKICLWQNLRGEMKIPDLRRDREFLNNAEASKGHFNDLYISDDIEIYSWVQFEKRSELVSKIVAKSSKVETQRSIHVGCTVEQLKERYSMNLSYVNDLGGLGPAYGYIPEDDSEAYIAFLVVDGIITEMIIEEAKMRPFLPKEGYVEQDVPWIPVDYSEKHTDAYARELYLGRHKDDLDPVAVLDRFLRRTFDGGNIFDRGIWKDKGNVEENLYYAIWDNDTASERVYVDIILKKIKIENYGNESIVWVVSKYKMQKKRR